MVCRRRVIMCIFTSHLETVEKCEKQKILLMHLEHWLLCGPKVCYVKQIWPHKKTKLNTKSFFAICTTVIIHLKWTAHVLHFISLHNIMFPSNILPTYIFNWLSISITIDVNYISVSPLSTTTDKKVKIKNKLKKGQKLIQIVFDW